MRPTRVDRGGFGPFTDKGLRLASSSLGDHVTDPRSQHRTKYQLRLELRLRALRATDPDPVQFGLLSAFSQVSGWLRVAEDRGFELTRPPERTHAPRPRFTLKLSVKSVPAQQMTSSEYMDLQGR